MAESKRPTIQSETDLKRVEALGFDSFLPQKTPYAILRACADRHPHRTAIRYLTAVGEPSRDVVISYRDLFAKVTRTANMFSRLGISGGDGVAILAPHMPEAQVALWAAGVVGRAFPINPLLDAEHLAALLKAARVKAAVVVGRNDEFDIRPNVIGTLRSVPDVKTVLEIGVDRPTEEADGNLEELAEDESSQELALGEPGPDAIAAYFHTGGTTGVPKLAQHRHVNQAFVARAAALMYALDFDDVVVNGFPLFHVAGSFVYGLSVLSAGATLLIPGMLGMRNRGFVTSIWKYVESHRITAIGGVPTVISALNEIPINADISSLRVMLTGGSPLPTELAEAFERRVRKPVRNILGMTECAGVVTIEPFHGSRVAGSTGLRLPFTSVKAFHDAGGKADLGKPCKAGEIGIIALNGPNVAPGYSNSALNSGTFDGSGWLVSGDLGHVDVDGRVFVTGRSKDVIIRGAHNIDPGVIEEVLIQHPAVGAAAAVGQPDRYAGELPVAFVSLKAGASVTAQELLKFAGPRVSEPAACPKQIWILPSLPLTPIGKIYKPELRKLAARRAIEDALTGAGVDSGSIFLEIEGDEAMLSVVRQEDANTKDQIQKALLGMPIKYRIVT
jgi:fatty-acyl-CoA synthase